MRERRFLDDNILFYFIGIAFLLFIITSICLVGFKGGFTKDSIKYLLLCLLVLAITVTYFVKVVI